jgi:hypothetical protein
MVKTGVHLIVFIRNYWKVTIEAREHHRFLGLRPLSLSRALRSALEWTSPAK